MKWVLHQNDVNTRRFELYQFLLSLFGEIYLLKDITRFHRRSTSYHLLYNDFNVRQINIPQLMETVLVGVSCIVIAITINHIKNWLYYKITLSCHDVWHTQSRIHLYKKISVQYSMNSYIRGQDKSLEQDSRSHFQKRFIMEERYETHFFTIQLRYENVNQR